MILSSRPHTTNFEFAKVSMIVRQKLGITLHILGEDHEMPGKDTAKLKRMGLNNQSKHKRLPACN